MPWPLITADQLTTCVHELPYTPPFAWPQLRDFYMAHPVPAQEWVDDDALGRTFTLDGARGFFTARHHAVGACFTVELSLNDLAATNGVLQGIRHMLDLDLDPALVESHLHQCFPHLPLVAGLRIPRLWNTFEAGVRAILGQQISVGAASKLVNTLVETLGHPIETPGGTRHLFPEPDALRETDLGFLSMVNARRETLARFARWYCEAGDSANRPECWLSLKGIGPWTANSAAMRGRGDCDMWIGNDLGIRKAMKVLDPEDSLDVTCAAPWRSYLTQQLWSQPEAWAPVRRLKTTLRT